MSYRRLIKETINLNIKEAFEKEQKELDSLKKALDNSMKMKKDYKL